MKNTLEQLAPVEAREVLCGVEHKLSKVPFGRFVAWVVRIEQPAMKVNGRFFKVDGNKCIKCGTCAKIVPLATSKRTETASSALAATALCAPDVLSIALRTLLT